MDDNIISDDKNHLIKNPSKEEILAARKLKKERKRQNRSLYDGQRPLPADGCCSYWLLHKNRYCSMNKRSGSDYCTDHLYIADGKKRIRCPIDPRHYIYEEDLEKHTKFRCPALQAIGEDDPWFSKDINLDPEYIKAQSSISDDEEIEKQFKKIAPAPKKHAALNQETGEPTPVEAPLFVAIPKIIAKRDQIRVSMLSLIEEGDLKPFFEKLDKIWLVHAPEIDSSLVISTHEPWVALQEGPIAPKKIKHAIQNNAIFTHLKAAGFFEQCGQKIFMEWGCGNANLSQLIQSHIHSDHILIDRKTPRAKSDHKKEKDKIWKRIVIDIKDLDINKITVLSKPSNSTTSYSGNSEVKLSSISKHLCGAATDLTLRCLQQLDPSSSCSVDSIAIALCCHHACSWSSYVGKRFISEELGFTRKDFEILIRVSSWATSEGDGHLPGESDPITFDISNMPLQARTMWGWRCKRVLDIGRLKFLESIGFETKFSYYVPTAVSLENIMMISTKKPSNGPE